MRWEYPGRLPEARHYATLFYFMESLARNVQNAKARGLGPASLWMTVACSATAHDLACVSMLGLGFPGAPNIACLVVGMCAADARW